MKRGETNICLMCRTMFFSPRPRAHCSDACRQKAYRQGLKSDRPGTKGAYDNARLLLKRLIETGNQRQLYSVVMEACHSMDDDRIVALYEAIKDRAQDTVTQRRYNSSGGAS